MEEWLKWWSAGSGACAHVVNVTAGYGAVNVAGPQARATLSKLTDHNLSGASSRYMRSSRAMVAGVYRAILLRIGFVGETGWELHFPAEYGEYMWDALMDAGSEFGSRALRFGSAAYPPLGKEAHHSGTRHRRYVQPLWRATWSGWCGSTRKTS